MLRVSPTTLQPSTPGRVVARGFTPTARTLIVTILFCDLVASTERRARLGDDDFDEFSRRYLVALENAIAEHNGRNIASAGDGLMVVFPESVADAIACATTMHRTVAELDPRDPPLLRIGISSGEVAEDGHGYSGMPIVEAARLESSAAPGQTLAHAIVRTLVGTRRAFRFRDVGALTLKGIPLPLSTVEVIDDEVLEAPLPHESKRSKRARSRPNKAVFATAGVIVVIAAVVAGLLATRSDSKAKVVPTPTPAALPAPKGYTPVYTSSACPATVLSVASDATCGHLVVPQDRDDPKSRTISLLVTSAPPRLPGATIAPTIDVCGCENLGNSLSRDHSKLIHVAIRGYAGSDPELTCPEMSAARNVALTKPSFDKTQLQLGTNAMRTCYARLVRAGVDPAMYNAETASQDLTDLMYAMNIHQANFVAFQATGLEAFEVLRRYPTAVRSLTLDNPPPPGTSLLTDSTGDLAAAFNRYVALCKADTTCETAYPTLAKAWTAGFANIQTNPVTVQVANPVATKPPEISVYLDGTRGTDGLAQALGDPNTYPLIPAAITQTTGQPEAATEAAAADFSPADDPWGADASFQCSYDINTLDRQAQILEVRTVPQFVRSDRLTWTQWCTVWKVPNITATVGQPIVSDVPTLMFRGNLSPDGNPSWISTIERGMSNAQSVIFPTLGRDLLSSGPACLSALRRAFLSNPTAKLDTDACAKQSPPIQFVAPSPQ